MIKVGQKVWWRGLIIPPYLIFVAWRKKSFLVALSFWDMRKTNSLHSVVLLKNAFHSLIGVNVLAVVLPLVIILIAVVALGVFFYWKRWEKTTWREDLLYLTNVKISISWNRKNGQDYFSKIHLDVGMILTYHEDKTLPFVLFLWCQPINLF